MESVRDSACPCLSGTDYGHFSGADRGQDLSGTLQGAGGVGGLLSRVSIGSTTSVVYYVHDGNGNVMNLVDDTGQNVVASYEYDPFGNCISATDAQAESNPWRFSSKYTDPETGLAMYPRRVYSPTLGRWLSKDPIEELGGENLYAFVWNEPIGIIDPFGLESFYRRKGEATAEVFFDPDDPKNPKIVRTPKQQIARWVRLDEDSTKFWVKGVDGVASRLRWHRRLTVNGTHASLAHLC